MDSDVNQLLSVGLMPALEDLKTQISALSNDTAKNVQELHSEVCEK